MEEITMRIQEAYQLPDGTITTPHWDEEIILGDQTAIDREELIGHVLQPNIWTTVSDPELKESWAPGLTVCHINPIDKTASIIEICHITEEHVCCMKGGKYPFSECLSPALVRRIIEPSDQAYTFVPFQMARALAWDPGWYCIFDTMSPVAYIKVELLAKASMEAMNKARRSRLAEALHAYLDKNTDN